MSGRLRQISWFCSVKTLYWTTSSVMPSDVTEGQQNKSCHLFVTSPKYAVISMTFNALKQADATIVEVPGTVSVTYHTPGLSLASNFTEYLEKKQSTTWCFYSVCC